MYTSSPKTVTWGAQFSDSKKKIEEKKTARKEPQKLDQPFWQAQKKGKNNPKTSDSKL